MISDCANPTPVTSNSLINNGSADRQTGNLISTDRFDYITYTYIRCCFKYVLRLLFTIFYPGYNCSIIVNAKSSLHMLSKLSTHWVIGQLFLKFSVLLKSDAKKS